MTETKTHQSPFAPVAFAVEPIPVPETHSGICDQLTRMRGSEVKCGRLAEHIYLNPDNAGFMVMCGRHFYELMHHAPEFFRSGRAVEYNDINIRRTLARWSKYGNTQPLEEFEEFKIPPPEFKNSETVSDENGFMLMRDGKTYVVDYKSEAEAKITGLGDATDAAKLYRKFHKYSYPWHYELEGLHTGDPIEILVVDVERDVDEYGWGVTYKTVVFADDFSPIDDDVWETYADEMNDVLKQDLSECESD